MFMWTKLRMYEPRLFDILITDPILDDPQGYFKITKGKII